MHINSHFFSCSKEVESAPVSAEDFRITAYIVGDICLDAESFNTSHFNQLTDIILFGVAAVDNGIGGMMVWHYACDLPEDNEKSLFNAIYGVKQEAIGAE